MKIMVTVGHDEVMEALREWLDKHGIPVVAVDQVRVEGKAGGSGFAHVTELRAHVQYECDAIGTGEARVIPEPVVEIRTKPSLGRLGPSHE